MHLMTTQADVRAECAKLGLFVTVSLGEYRITFPASEIHSSEQREALAYYTEDADDAIGTARLMRAEQNLIDRN